MLLLQLFLLCEILSVGISTPVGVKETLVKNDNVKRGAVRSAKYRWPITTVDGKNTVVIPYVMDSGLKSEAISELERAFQDLHGVTCVRFQPRSGQSDYASFEGGGSSCASPYGKRKGKTVIRLGDDCEIKGIILHELVHLLGFYHEHNRPDRDSYIRIFKDNIRDDAKDDIMEIYERGAMDNLGFSYDLHSIMQYQKTTFAKREGLVTMEARSDPNMELGNENAMSADDIMKINEMYRCPGRNDQYKNMKVTVTTASGWWSGSGTNAFLYLELIGQGGKRSGESSVAKGGRYDDFESGMTDHYLVAFKDVGAISQLKVRLQENPDGSRFDGWTFDRIVIKDGSQVYTFCGGDLYPGKSVTVDASQSCP